MKISFVPQADAIYISLQDGAQDVRVVRLNEDVAVDYGVNDEIVGLEVLNARRLLGTGTPVVELQNVIGRPAR